VEVLISRAVLATLYRNVHENPRTEQKQGFTR